MRKYRILMSWFTVDKIMDVILYELEVKYIDGTSKEYRLRGATTEKPYLIVLSVGQDIQYHECI